MGGAKAGAITTFSIFFLVSLAGCADRPHHYEPPRFPPLDRGVGIGLNLSDTRPGLGAFLEGAGAQKVIDYLLEEAPTEALVSCPNTHWRRAELVAQVENALQDPSPLRTGVFDVYSRNCQGSIGSAEVLRTMFPEKSVEEAWSSLVTETHKAIDESAVSLSAAMDRVGSVADAEFLAGAMASHVSARSLMERNDGPFGDYKSDLGPTTLAPPTTWRDGDPTPYHDDRPGLDLAIRNVHMALIRAQVGRPLVDGFPWGDGPCRAPEPAAIVSRILGARGEALGKANEVIAPGDEFSDWSLKWLDGYQNGEHWIGANFLYFQQRGWWPALLVEQMRIEEEREYWNLYANAPLPTVDEARMLVARSMNESRTLVTGPKLVDVWHGLRDLESDSIYSRGNHGWGLRAEHSLNAVVIGKVPWTFADVECTPGTA